MKALIDIQNELKAPKNQRNNFGKYNYRSCEDILEALKPLLVKHKATLTITDEVKQVGDLLFIESTVTFSHLDKHEPIIAKAQAGINPNRKGMDIAQSFGTSSSYARKYALNGLFLIDDTKEVDSMDNTKTKPLLTSKVAQEESKNKTTIEELKKRFDLTEEQENKYKSLLK